MASEDVAKLGDPLDPTAGLAEAQDDPADAMYEEEEQEEQPLLIAPGVMDIDKKLGGGLPLESVTLVEGDPESGKSVLMQQLSYGALKEGLRTSIFLSEQSIREYLGQMTSLGMDTTDYYLLRRLSLYQTNFRVGQDRAELLTKRLLKFIEDADSHDLVIVDSLTPILFQFDARYVLSFLAACKELANAGKTILVTLHSYAINESLRLRAGSIVDCHLRLRIEEMGQQVVRTMEVCKIRGAVKTIANTVSFSVEPGLGLKTIPISKTKA
jgi:flagellar protein FlaH